MARQVIANESWRHGEVLDGANWPASWDIAYRKGVVDIASAGPADPSAGGRMQPDPDTDGAGTSAVLTDMPALADAELEIYLNWPDDDAEHFVGVALRVSSFRPDTIEVTDEFPLDGYVLLIQNGSTHAGFQVLRIVNGVSAIIGGDSLLDGNGAGLLAGIQFQVQGATIRANVWNAELGTAPETWMSEITDGSPYRTAGKVGLFTRGDGMHDPAPIIWHDLTVLNIGPRITLAPVDDTPTTPTTSLAPREFTVEATVPGVAAAVSDAIAIGEVAEDGVVISATYTPEADMTGAAANIRILSVVNKGQDGTGTAVIATLRFGTGITAPAFDATALELSRVAGRLDVSQGDVLALVTAATGTGIPDPGGRIQVGMTRR